MCDEMKFFDHLNLKKCTCLLFLIVFIFFDLFGVTFACFKKDKSQPLPLTTSTIKPKFQPIKKTIVIESSKTCSLDNESGKSILICFNEGKCMTRDSPLNDTHTEKIVYCECVRPYSGNDCRANDSFEHGGLGLVAIILVSIASIVVIIYLIYKFVYKKRCKKNTPVNRQENVDHRGGSDVTNQLLTPNTDNRANNLGNNSGHGINEKLARINSNGYSDAIENYNSSNENSTNDKEGRA